MRRRRVAVTSAKKSDFAGQRRGRGGAARAYKVKKQDPTGLHSFFASKRLYLSKRGKGRGFEQSSNRATQRAGCTQVLGDLEGPPISTWGEINPNKIRSAAK